MFKTVSQTNEVLTDKISAFIASGTLVNSANCDCEI